MGRRRSCFPSPGGPLSMDPQHAAVLAGESKDRFDGIVAAFEAAWEAHLHDTAPPPAIPEHLPAEEPLRALVALELALIDLERRLTRGEPVRLESYLDKLPVLKTDRNAVRLLIATEYEYRLRSEVRLQP